MAFKLVVLSCLLALAQGSVVAPTAIAAAPVAPAPVPYGSAHIAARIAKSDSLPLYRFGYNVADTVTGDFKSQNEERDGDLVRGQYSLLESDGTRRVVTYTADPVNGFNAIVRNEPIAEVATAVVRERIAAAPAELEPAVVAKSPRIVAAPIVAPSPGAPAPFIRYATAPVSIATAAAEPVFARYAQYASAPVIEARYGAPVAAAFRAAYTAPISTAYSAYPATYTAAYTAPFATAYSLPINAAYPAPFAPVYGTPVAARLAVARAVSTATTPAAANNGRAAPAKLVESASTVGYP